MSGSILLVTKSKKWWLLAVCFFGAVVFGVAGWRLVRWRWQASYAGKPVSYWFAEYYQKSEADPRRRQRMAVALYVLEKLGTNAVPYLVKEALSPREDSSMRKGYYDFLTVFPDSWHVPQFVSRSAIRSRAAMVIDSIHPPADILLPRLLEPLSRTNTVDRQRAISILSSVREGRETLVPYFVNALHDPDPHTQIEAVEFLDKLGSQASVAVPDLMAVVKNTNPTNILCLEAAYVLGNIGSNSVPAIPLLNTVYEQQTDWLVRCSLAAVLCRIDLQQTNALRFLIDNLDEPQSPGKVRWVVRQLQWIGPNATPAIPAVLKIAKTVDWEAWTTAVDALKEIGASAELYLPVLHEKLASDNEKSRYIAAARILDLTPSDTNARAVMIDLIKRRSEYESWAISDLGDTGTNARVAVAIIMDTLNGTNVACWTAVPKALKKIGVSPGSYLPKVKEKLKSSSDWARLRMAEEILAIQPTDREALMTLIALLKSNSKYELLALKALAENGPAAQVAIPAIRELLKSDDLISRDMASDALKKISQR